ncbi:MAG TPA: hypothetical protein VGL06_10550 [Pseudonocardiaceae bacterium]
MVSQSLRHIMLEGSDTGRWPWWWLAARSVMLAGDVVPGAVNVPTVVWWARLVRSISFDRTYGRPDRTAALDAVADSWHRVGQRSVRR